MKTAFAQTYTVTVKNEHKRLDLFLAEVSGIARSQIQRAIREGLVKVDDKVVLKPNYRLKNNQSVFFTPLPPEESKLEPEDIPLDILFEDEHIIVVNKPSGLVVHPAPGHFTGTLVHALLNHCHDLSGIGGVKRPGIVHRLDKDTSGVLLVAKHDKAHLDLSEQFKNRIIQKQYLCVVLGQPNQTWGEVNFPIGRHPTNRKKFSIHTKTPREALTLWRLREGYKYCSLLLCLPKTGRTHQIRVHLTAIGHPIIGDPLYLKKSRLGKIEDKKVRLILKQTPRLMLHAWRISFIHPISGKEMQFEAPIPDDMKKLIQEIKKASFEAV